MARKIIVLNKQNFGYSGAAGADNYQVDYVFWLDVPAAQRPMLANANAGSSVADATADELAAIRTGAVIEERGVESATTATTLGTLGARLVAKYNARQAEINAVTQYAYFGTFWDGTTWTVKGA